MVGGGGGIQGKHAFRASWALRAVGCVIHFTMPDQGGQGNFFEWQLQLQNNK